METVTTEGLEQDFWLPLRSNLAHTFHSKPVSWLLTPFPDADLSGLLTQAQVHRHTHDNRLCS